jgi:CubicO group peptidase (beta-lactamase class C family)
MAKPSEQLDRDDTSFSTPTIRRVEQRIAAARVPGCVVSMISPGRGTRGMAIGLADVASGRATTVDTVFHLFSGTKLFTASALMLLVEKGALTLDMDVRELLPEVELRNRVTLRQLASHDSGLPDTLRAFLSVHFPGEARPTTREAVARYSFAKGTLPGRGAQYRNANYALLAEVIARTSATSYERFVSEQLLVPWGSHATFEVGAVPREHLATGHVRRFDPMRLAVRWLLGERGRRIFRSAGDGYVGVREFDLDCAGIGGLLGAAADFAPILTELASPEDGLLTARSKREMLTLHSRGKAGVVSAEGVGIGWKCGRAEGARFWNHEGGGAGFCTELRLYPEAGVGFVVLMNLSQSKRLSMLVHDICEMLRRE